jgi:hypothetical protein
MRYHLTLVTMAVTKKIEKINANKDNKKGELSLTVGGNIN